MILEDHLGDILRKARAAIGVSLETAAELGGLSPAQYLGLEHTGACPAPLNFQKLGPVLRLHPGKLQAIAQGWGPQTPDLAQWRELRRITTTGNDLTVHCYVIWDEVSREAALFDTGWEADPIATLISENELQLKHVFLTHTHDDHMNALGALRERFPKILLHTNSKTAPPQHRNRSKDFIHLGSLRITNREAPGHAEDGVCYIVGNWPEDAPHAAFCGDTIFAGSIATGHASYDLLKQSIQTQLFSLPSSTLLCPGHGPFTTVEEEKSHNPFFP